MLKDRKRLERTLSLAEKAQSTFEEKLTASGVADKARKKNTTWRHLDASRREVKRRLLAVALVEQREVVALQRKADKDAGVEAAAE
jgi:hypothetical protein